ncbi:hypothetical protein SAMN05660706_1486 [Desulfoscipio geothermicus DSM 3669]|uniref:Vitamin B12 dependent methionine synthase, activation domain n=2 Tax=Desulfoscipio geothermicus TaxID=39060 RepID=A0A1I6EJE9_9FIRM|nr:hypothetical protein SAMN05660706_1486 [Desulfoscipio geothermicus DSM 3669]
MHDLMNYHKFDLQLNKDDIACSVWNNLSKTANPSSNDLPERVLDEAHQLARVKAVCKTMKIIKTTDRQVFLEGGQALTSSLLVCLAGPAQSLFLAICTLGDLIDKRVDEYNRRGLAAHAYFLDVAGTCLIESAGRKLVKQVKNKFNSAGYKTTIPLGPGHSYWKNFIDQQIIYDLLNPKDLGVKILSSGMMLPKKTLSLVMGIGHELPPSKENHCHYCGIGHKCPLSRALRPAK